MVQDRSSLPSDNAGESEHASKDPAVEFVGRSYYGSAPAATATGKSFAERVAESRMRKNGMAPDSALSTDASVAVPSMSAQSSLRAPSPAPSPSIRPDGAAETRMHAAGDRVAVQPHVRGGVERIVVDAAAPAQQRRETPVSANRTVSDYAADSDDTPTPCSDDGAGPFEENGLPYGAFEDASASADDGFEEADDIPESRIGIIDGPRGGAHAGRIEWLNGKAPTVAPYGKPAHGKKRRKPRIAIAASCLLALIVVAAGLFAWMNQTVTVRVNGEEVTLRKNSSIEEIIDRGFAAPKPGDLLAVDGAVITEGEGEPFTAYLDDRLVSDNVSLLLDDGVDLRIEDGADITETYTETEIEVPPSVVESGTGAIHVYLDDGVPGKAKRKTGDISGNIVDDVVEEPVNRTLKRYNADTGGEKVIALTFDDGPWASPDTTRQILDILDEYDAKATFFCVGERVDGVKDQVQRAYESGHQICTHSWDHAAGDGQGVNLTYMTPEDQVAEIVKGYQAIEHATGQEASTVIRVPGGNFYGELLTNLAPHVSADIGWNIDTMDWSRPGTESIAEKILQAGPGDIILMHDGGGDRTQTVEALKQALPVLAEEGYRFITVDELLEYNDPAEM